MEHYINEKTVMQFYITQAQQDQIIFLQNHEKEKAEICSLIQQLMREQTMNRQLQIACQLWKKLFTASMSYISPNRQGYDKLFSFFDSYVEFEELIFASDSFYRDHTLHCIWVYFLGEYLKRNEEFHSLFADQEKQLHLLSAMQEVFLTAGIVSGENYQKLSKAVDLVKRIIDNDEAARCVAALTHDLGYPLKKVEKINRSIQKVLPYFGVQNARDFDFEYTNIQKNFIDQFLDFLSRNLRTQFHFENSADAEALFKLTEIKNNDIVGINKAAIRALSQEDRERFAASYAVEVNFKEDIATKLGFSSDFEEYRHGIMSAFLLCKNLQAFQSINYDAQNGALCSEESSRMLALQGILNSISLHTSDILKISELKIHNYLTFVDELEEFSRISRASQNREYVKEFCDTALYMEDGWLNIVFEFNNASLDNLNPEISFKGRCKRFLTLFDVPNLSGNLKLRVCCIGKLPGNQNTYTLEIAHKYADIRINGESVRIPAYLKSNQFYTKEEYAAL